MRPSAALHLRERSLDDAASAISSGNLVRQAAFANRVAKSTAFERLQKVRNGNFPRAKRSALTDVEESHLVAFAPPLADMGVPLTRRHLIEAAAMFIEQLPFLRRTKLPFTNGKTWLQVAARILRAS